MKLSALFCLIALSFCVSAEEKPIALQENANEVFRLIQERNPAILEQMTNEQIRDALSLMLDASETGLAIVEDLEQPEEEGEKLAVAPPQMFAEDKLLYLCANSLGTIPNQFPGKTPVGIVLDLRFCQTGTVEQALALSKRDFGVPVTVLISPQTGGAAEIAVALLAKEKKVITIGEETKGTPYPAEYIQLKCGGYLRVPMPPKELKDIPYRPVRPMIELFPDDNAPVGLGKTKDSWQEDPVLRRAGDLLIALDRIVKKGTEK